MTGTHGDARHLGNIRSNDRNDPEKMDVESGANRQTLEKIVNVEPYLTPHSDLVALLVLEHQTQMHNLIARASMEARIAAHYDRGINEALGRPLDTVSDSTTRRIEAASEALVRYMLFADEQKLACPVQGTSPFAENFAKDSPRDPQGRSLRDLDLTTYLFKYPCSYLIYSQAFDQLPPPVMHYIHHRLTEVLTAPEPPEGYQQLDASQRLAIAEILRATKPGLLVE